MNLRPIAASVFVCALFVTPGAGAQSDSVDVPGGPVPIQILVRGPADTTTELQVICLFRSSPENSLHGSLTEANEKLKGLLDQVRRQELFRGEPGETLLIAPRNNTLGAKRLLIIGLGDSRSFTPERMQLVGEVLYAEASRMGVAHPFFAPTVLDGGVNRFATGEVAEQVIGGFLRGAAIDKVLRAAHVSTGPGVTALTFLAGAKNVSSTREGIEKAIRSAAGK